MASRNDIDRVAPMPRSRWRRDKALRVVTVLMEDETARRRREN